jgi:hypothetical protein
MGKKNGMTYFSEKVYSKKYENLYKNKKFSDITIKFENSNETIPAHKFALSSGSKFFEEIIDSKDFNNEILIKKENDQEEVEIMLKFFYTGSIEFQSEKQVIRFLLMGIKFDVTDMDDFKVASKKLLFEMMEYVEEDEENRIKDFEKLIDNIDFKKFGHSALKKLVKGHKWLKKSSKFLNMIVLKQDESEPSNSETSSGEDTEELPKFLPKKSSDHFKFSKNDRLSVPKSNNNNNFSGPKFLVVSKSNKITIKVQNAIGVLLFGFEILKNLDLNMKNYPSYCFNLYEGETISKGENSAKKVCEGIVLKKNDVFTLKNNDNKISFSYNQKNLGVIFTIKNFEKYNLILLTDDSEYQIVK